MRAGRRLFNSCLEGEREGADQRHDQRIATFLRGSEVPEPRGAVGHLARGKALCRVGGGKEEKGERVGNGEGGGEVKG